ncbi:MAG: hypothetical protein WCR59_00610 [Planctomycetota bacterium]
MPITKNITLDSGLVVTYHRIESVVTLMNQNAEIVIASVQSWVDKTRADNEEDAHFTSYQIAITPQPGMVAKAEQALVVDSTCPLFGGTVTPDVILSDLDTAKAKKKSEIASARSVEMYADKTTSLGVFGSTESDNNKLSIAIQVTQLAAAAGQPAECGYKTADGVYSIYTLAQLEQIALEIAAQVLPLYAKESAKVAEIDAATDVAAVEAVSW